MLIFKIIINHSIRNTILSSVDTINALICNLPIKTIISLLCNSIHNGYIRFLKCACNKFGRQLYGISGNHSRNSTQSISISPVKLEYMTVFIELKGFIKLKSCAPTPVMSEICNLAYRPERKEDLAWSIEYHIWSWNFIKISCMRDVLQHHTAACGSGRGATIVHPAWFALWICRAQRQSEHIDIANWRIPTTLQKPVAFTQKLKCYSITCHSFDYIEWCIF